MSDRCIVCSQPTPGTTKIDGTRYPICFDCYLNSNDEELAEVVANLKGVEE